MEQNKASFRGMQIYYKNKVEFDFLVDEIFDSETYAFKSLRESPFIIDCGAHIGISVLYFKSIFPNSRIIAFEPDPANFELLRKNIAANGLEGVECHQLALAGTEGTRAFYGDFGSSSESVGNTLKPNWGERPGFEKIDVRSDRLSNYISEQVDFLKIDIEGAEDEVLAEIEDRLKMVKTICVEVHEMNNTGATCKHVCDTLSDAGFVLSYEELDVRQILYKRFPDWVAKNNPIIFMVKGENSKCV